MKRFFLLIVSVLAVFSAFAQGNTVLPNDPAVKVGKLDNGMTYYIRHNENPAGRAEFYLATNVGAIQETADQDGLAHFLEHMCFNGTKNFPDKGILDYLQSIGASFGENVNASTGVERTQYMLNNIPVARQSVIDTCILIMHDYSHFVTNDPVEIDKERSVILEERRARRNAAFRLNERSYPYFYGDSKYAGCNIIGSEDNLKNFRPESLHDFYRTWYRPDLQALMVVGDVDVDYVENKIREIFADIPAAENPKPKDVIMIPGNENPVVGILTDPEYSQYDMYVLWKSDAAPLERNNTVEGAVEDMLKTVVSLVLQERMHDVTSDPSSPLLSAGTGVGNLTETMEVLLGSLSFSEGNALDGLAVFLTEMEKARRFGFSEDEIDRAKETLLSSYESAAKSAATRTNPELIPELMSNFFSNYAFMEPSQEYELARQILPMLGVEVVNMALPQMITDENMVLVYKAPEKAGAVHPTEQQVLDVIARVRASDIAANETEAVGSDFIDPSSLRGSRVKKTGTGAYGSTVWTLGNGLKVVLFPTEYEKDAVSFNLFKNGGLSILTDEETASFDDYIWEQFMSNCGVAQFPAATVRKMLSGKNLSVQPYLNIVRHGISGVCSPKDLETAFQIAYLQFASPRFDQKEYDKGIGTLAAVLPNLESQPDYQLQKAVHEIVYEGNHRKHLISGELLEKASLQKIEKAYRRIFNDVAGAELVIVGDFLPETIRPLVEKYFGSLPKGRKATEWAAVPGISDKTLKKDFTVDMQTPMSTVIDVFKARVPFSYDRQAEMEALAYILDMRYVSSLREEEGGTYGAQTAADANIVPEQYLILQIAFNSKPQLTDRLRELAYADLEDLAANGPTAEEFSMARKNLEKTVPENRIRNGWWLSAIIIHDSLGLDRVNDYEQAVMNLTPEAVGKAARTMLDGNRLEIIMRPGISAEAE